MKLGSHAATIPHPGLDFLAASVAQRVGFPFFLPPRKEEKVL